MKKNSKHLLKLLCTASVFFAVQFSLSAEVRFGGLDLNYQDRLLFTAYQNIPGTAPYTSLLMAELGKTSVRGTPQMLTCFPEKLELLNENNNLQIRNRYGRALYNEASNTLVWTSTADRIPVEYTHMGPQAVSPDGKWLCYVKRTRNSQGQLILQNTSTTEEKILVKTVSFSYSKVNVKWSPDSNAVLYEKNGYVYFFTPSLNAINMQLPEEYCRIGKGTIDNVNWTEEKSLIYIDGDIVYKIYENELYTRGLYSDMIGSGKIIGHLPTAFNSLHDRFWCDSFCRQLVVINGNNVISTYTLPVKSSDSFAIKSIIPLAVLEGTLLDYKVFWTDELKPFLWTDILLFESGTKASSVYSIEDKMNLILTVKGSLDPQLSPDKRHLAFTGGNSLYVYDTNTWNQTAKYNGEKIISFVWKDKLNLYIGGNQTVFVWGFDSKAVAAASLKGQEYIPAAGTSKFLFLSSVSTAFWNGEKIVAYPSQGEKCYSYDQKNNIWIPEEKSIRIPSELNLQNKTHRVFLDKVNNELYSNGILVRSISGRVITYDLYDDTAVKKPAPKKAAIVIDAMDNSEGVAYILAALEEYGIKATFFLNGEFIRRYPEETKQIASKGYECGSLFFTTGDLTSDNLVLNEDFVLRGLARNEDEFNSLTGKELSLLWHAPYYHQTELIRNAGSKAGYKYVRASTGYSDTVTVEKEAENPFYLYLNASQLIDAIVASLEDRIIIPVSAGKVRGTRHDYLYEKMDILIASILNQGYEIVDVRSVID